MAQFPSLANSDPNTLKALYGQLVARMKDLDAATVDAMMDVQTGVAATTEFLTLYNVNQWIDKRAARPSERAYTKHDKYAMYDRDGKPNYLNDQMWARVPKEEKERVAQGLKELAAAFKQGRAAFENGRWPRIKGKPVPPHEYDRLKEAGLLED